MWRWLSSRERGEGEGKDCGWRNAAQRDGLVVWVQGRPCVALARGYARRPSKPKAKSETKQRKRRKRAQARFLPQVPTAAPFATAPRVGAGRGPSPPARWRRGAGGKTRAAAGGQGRAGQQTDKTGRWATTTRHAQRTTTQRRSAASAKDSVAGIEHRASTAAKQRPERARK